MWCVSGTLGAVTELGPTCSVSPSLTIGYQYTTQVPCLLSTLMPPTPPPPNTLNGPQAQAIIGEPVSTWVSPMRQPWAWRYPLPPPSSANTIPLPQPDPASSLRTPLTQPELMVSVQGLRFQFSQVSEATSCTAGGRGGALPALCPQLNKGLREGQGEKAVGTQEDTDTQLALVPTGPCTDRDPSFPLPTTLSQPALPPLPPARSLKSQTLNPQPSRTAHSPSGQCGQEPFSYPTT